MRDRASSELRERFARRALDYGDHSVALVAERLGVEQPDLRRMLQGKKRWPMLAQRKAYYAYGVEPPAAERRSGVALSKQPYKDKKPHRKGRRP